MAAAALARTRRRAQRLMRAARRALLTAVALAACAAGSARGDEGPKQLVRVGGTVEYQRDLQSPPHEMFGSLELPDDATAVTLAASRAAVRLPDSTEIDIGERSRIRIGAFDANGLAANVVTLEVGAIHFTVRRPAGGRANYLFQTPTSQIAVRGTEGYIVTGPNGTDVYCAACEPGDVTVTVADRTFALVTGDQAIVVGADPANARVDLVAQPCGNPAAIAISDGKLGRTIPPERRVDTTGALGADPLVAVPLPGERRGQ
jgi:hypothetical protein